jgi:phosphate transport system protein
VQKFFDLELNALKSQIVEMGSSVERAVDFAIRGLIERKPEYFNQVHALEQKINKHHIEVDEACLRILARQAPMASDLRVVLAIIKINTDLERMGDQAVNIAHSGKHYISEAPLKPLEDIPKMAEQVRVMIRQSLDACFPADPKLAREVVMKDDIVDGYKNKVFHDLVALIKTNPDVCERALDLILIARNLERLGDHATNIAEDAIFIASGEDIRHGGVNRSVS